MAINVKQGEFIPERIANNIKEYYNQLNQLLSTELDAFELEFKEVGRDREFEGNVDSWCVCYESTCNIRIKNGIHLTEDERDELYDSLEEIFKKAPNENVRFYSTGIESNRVDLLIIYTLIFEYDIF